MTLLLSFILLSILSGAHNYNNTCNCSWEHANCTVFVGDTSPSSACNWQEHGISQTDVYNLHVCNYTCWWVVVRATRYSGWLTLSRWLLYMCPTESHASISTYTHKLAAATAHIPWYSSPIASPRPPHVLHSAQLWNLKKIMLLLHMYVMTWQCVVLRHCIINDWENYHIIFIMCVFE